MMRALVLAQSWDQILDGKSLPEYKRPREEAWRHWAMALAQTAKGDAVAARAEAREMDAALKQFEVEVKRKPPVELTAGRMELEGHILAVEGKYKQAMSELTSASNAQRKIRYTEPPQYPRPVNEAIGEIAKRREQAIPMLKRRSASRCRICRAARRSAQRSGR